MSLKILLRLYTFLGQRKLHPGGSFSFYFFISFYTRDTKNATIDRRLLLRRGSLQTGTATDGTANDERTLGEGTRAMCIYTFIGLFSLCLLYLPRRNGGSERLQHHVCTQTWSSGIGGGVGYKNRRQETDSTMSHAKVHSS